jgi:LuxR family transcriptional regulator, maltose regulon positive regulatory protein
MEAHRTTTFTPPQLPLIVARPRLLKRLDTRPAPKLILLLGQAAQGKTTLAAAYLQTQQIPVAWIDLDGTAADPANFYYLLVRALETTGLLGNPTPFLDNPVLALGAGDGIQRWRARLRALVDHWDGDGILVIDGLERIPRTSAGVDLLQTLLDHLPDGLRIILLSQSEPRLRFQHLRLRRQAMMITNRELAFSKEEIAAFFDQVASIELSAEQVGRVDAMTGGWVGGLVLLSAAMARIAAGRQARYLAEKAPAQLNGDALRFFSETVFMAQPESIQAFLLRSAVLDTLTVSDATRLCGVADAKPFLDELVQHHLFVQAFEEPGGQRIYRYHHLFHAFLRSRLAEWASPAEVAALEERAGDLYWEHGATEAAITHYLCAKMEAKAAAGVKKIGVDLFIRGRQADLAGWLNRLSESSISKDPWLRLLRVLSHRIHGGHHNQEDLGVALRQFRSEKDIRGELLALAFLIESGVFLGTEVSRQLTWMHAAEALLGEMKGTLRYLFARTMLWLQVGIGRIVGGLDAALGCAACRKALLLADQMGDAALRLNALVGLALGEVYRGDFDAAKAALAEAAGCEHSSTYPEYHILDRLVRVELAIHRGEHQAAAGMLAAVQDAIESFGLLFLYPVYLDQCGWLAIARQDARAALQYGYQLADVAALAANPFYEGLALRMMALANYHQGRYDLAHRQVTGAARCLQPDASLELYRAHCDLILGLVLRRRGDLHRAQALLSQLLSEPWVMQGQPKEVADSHLVAEARLALALILRKPAGGAAEASRLQAAWMRLTAGGRCAFLFLSEADVRDLRCFLPSEEGGTPRTPAGETIGAGELAASAIHSPSDPFPASRPKNGPNVPLLDIQTFGGLSVAAMGAHPIDDRDWGGRQPKLLLKAIIVHGLRDIPKEVLIEDLWPEADPAATARNFKVTLHRLRKALQPELEPGVRSAYVHLHEGRISLDETHCRVDVGRFLEVAKRIKNGGSRLDGDALLALCRQARQLYKNDFLPEEPYAPWVEVKRSALRDTYQQIIQTEARVLAREGRLEAAADGYADLLQLDPCQEAAAQALMTLYARLGRRGDALQVYKGFATTLKQQLGAPPDIRTQALYKHIQTGDSV